MVTIPDNIDTDRINSVYSVLLQNTINTLTNELNANRIKNSEYGDIIKGIIPHILDEAIKVSQLDLDLIRLQLEKEKVDSEIELNKERLRIERERFYIQKRIDLQRLKYDKERLELEKEKLELEKEKLALDKKLLKEQIRTEQNRNRNERLQGELIKRQTQSFDDKVLLELLGIQVNGWTMYASSIGIDADSMLGILNGDNTRELYEKLIDKFGIEYQE